MSLENVIETDVLIIGGGMAGLFAAIKSKGEGVDVTLVDKGYAGKSGATPWCHTYSVFHTEWGHNLDEWMNHINTVGEFVNNRTWTEIVFKESYDRYQDFVSWGVDFRKDEIGELFRWKMSPHRPCDSLEFGGDRRKKSRILRDQAVKSGATIFDRIMVVELLKQDGRVVGAIGIPMDSNDLYIFKAKAIIISTGAATFKPTGWPVAELTGDGQAMAYRSGAQLIGNEFLDMHGCQANPPLYNDAISRDNHGNMVSPPWHLLKNGKANKNPSYFVDIRGAIINAEGDEVPYNNDCNTFHFELETEAHAGRAPLSRHGSSMIGGSTGGMANHTSEGIWPVNTKCASNIPGLYAAGDSLGTMQVGAVYPTVGVASAGASVTGARAGLAAAEYAKQITKPSIDGETLENIKKSVHAPLDRKGGFTPGWVTQLLQNITRPYFIFFIKNEKRLQAALTLVEFLWKHLAPNLYAKDPHELRLVHETKNMILNAQMKLKASLYRTESRGWFYREDYPLRDDPAWLAWVNLKEEKGEMKLWKEQIPKKWWPDLSKPYNERYPVRFPGE